MRIGNIWTFDNKQNTDVSSILYILYMCIKYYNIDNIITNKKKHTPPTHVHIHIQQQQQQLLHFFIMHHHSK